MVGSTMHFPGTVQPTPIPPHLLELAATLPLMCTMGEVLAALRLSERMIRRLVADGSLRAVRSSSTGSARLVIPRSEIIKYLAQHPAR